VILAIEEDDAQTLEAARAAAGPGVRIVAVPPGGPRTKPKALTYALAFARGALLTIYDAEDRPHPDQLRAAAAAFADGGPGLVCLQAPLAYYNAGRNWLTRCFQLEYAIHFRVVLPALIRMGAPIPLGGTSNHFRTAQLKQAGGWDPFNVTEDADLGFRILSAGARAAMIAPPTLEEATCSIPAWTRQRSRWLKGYAQTVLVHTRPAPGAFRPVKAAAMWLTLGGALAAAIVHAPALVWLAFALAAGSKAGLAALAILTAGYLSTAAAACAAARLTGDRALLRGLVYLQLYWPLQTLAAALAMAQLVAAPFRWEKTEHGVGRRRPAPAEAGLRIAAE
jgi:cellulose synthase/poly-beta-1,6-N-acetylglucosamine synthase-like glycosyltransferase